MKSSFAGRLGGVDKGASAAGSPAGAGGGGCRSLLPILASFIRSTEFRQNEGPAQGKGRWACTRRWPCRIAAPRASVWKIPYQRRLFLAGILRKNPDGIEPPARRGHGDGARLRPRRRTIATSKALLWRAAWPLELRRGRARGRGRIRLRIGRLRGGRSRPVIDSSQRDPISDAFAYGFCGA